MGASESPIFILPDLRTSTTYKSVALNVVREADLNANFYYFTLHSTTFLDVEISGLLIKQVTGSDAPPAPLGY